MKSLHPEGTFEAKIIKPVRIIPKYHLLGLKVKTEHGKLFVSVAGSLVTLELLGKALTALRGQKIIISVEHRTAQDYSSVSVITKAIAGDLLL